LAWGRLGHGLPKMVRQFSEAIRAALTSNEGAQPQEKKEGQ
jgi:hypothetical protein